MNPHFDQELAPLKTFSYLSTQLFIRDSPSNVIISKLCLLPPDSPLSFLTCDLQLFHFLISCSSLIFFKVLSCQLEKLIQMHLSNT